MKLSQTYSKTTPESIENGDFSESGFVFENEKYTFLELLNYLKSEGYYYPSDEPMQFSKNPTWMCTDSTVINYTTGEAITQYLHFDCNNKPRYLKYWKKALEYHINYINKIGA